MTLLAVLPNPYDRAMLHRIVDGASWDLQFASSVDEALKVLDGDEHQPEMILSDRRFADGRGWRDLLAKLSELKSPSALVVTDDSEGGDLWGEVLNLGGCDVLPKPFRWTEVSHAVDHALRHSRAKLAAAA